MMERKGRQVTGTDMEYEIIRSSRRTMGLEIKNGRIFRQAESWRISAVADGVLSSVLSRIRTVPAV